MDDQFYKWFTDEADVENWKDSIKRIDICWKDKGGSFLNCWMKYMQRYEEMWHLERAGFDDRTAAWQNVQSLGDHK